MGMRVALTWLYGVMAVVVSGCVIENFPKDEDRYANGCERAPTAASSPTPQMILSPNSAPYCMTVSVGATIDFVLDSSDDTCRLHGGFSDGNEGERDPNSWIERDTQGAGKKLEAMKLYPVPAGDARAVIPFYCEGMAQRAGAIFVGVRLP